MCKETLTKLIDVALNFCYDVINCIIKERGILSKKKSLSIKVARLLLALSVTIVATSASPWFFVGEPELPKSLREK